MDIDQRTEGYILNDIFKALWDKGYRPIRMYMGPVAVQRKGGVRWRKNPNAGFPDLFGFFLAGQGRMWTIEVKRAHKDAKTSEVQEKWIERLSNSGVFVVVARSADYAVQQIIERDAFFHSYDRRKNNAES